MVNKMNTSIDLRDHITVMDKIAFYLNFLLKKEEHPGSIKQMNTDLPSSFKLYNNYPNPSSSGTAIKFSLPVSSFVKLEILDSDKNPVQTLLNNINTVAGWHIVYFDSTTIKSGRYFYKLKADDIEFSKEMIVV